MMPFSSCISTKSASLAVTGELFAEDGELLSGPADEGHVGGGDDGALQGEGGPACTRNGGVAALLRSAEQQEEA